MGMIPAILPTTASKLDSARNSLDAVQARLVRLADDRVAAVVGDGDVEAVRKVDLEIEKARGEIVAYGERIAALEARAAVEERARREAEHRAAIERFGKTLAPIADAADDMERSARAFVAALNRYQRATAAAAAAWPPGVVAWNSDHLAGGRMGEMIRECFSPGGLWRRRGSDILPGPSGYEYAERASTADQRVAGFADGERRHHTALMEDLRSQPVSEPMPALDELAA